MSNTVLIPDNFYCPITGLIMNNPVIDEYGHSYEENAYREWLRINPISPKTRGAINIERLRANRDLKSAIDQIRDKIKYDEMKKESLSIIKDKPELYKKLNEIDINHSIKLFDNKMMVTVSVPICVERRSIKIVFVIDTSSSMGVDATIKNESGSELSHGMSILELVGAAVKTVAKSLNSNDQVGIVSFNTNFTVETRDENCCDTLLKMCNSGKLKIDKIIDKMVPQGCTNLWLGIFNGLELLRKNTLEGDIAVLLLLTDGLPTRSDEPPNGYINHINLYKDMYPNFNFIFDTAGFGINLDSELLEKISNLNRGDYGYIPDSSLAANVFSHKTSKILTTAVINSIIKIESNNSDFIESCLGYNKIFKKTSWGCSIETGPLNYGQNKHFVFNIRSNIKPIILSSIEYNNLDGSANTKSIKWSENELKAKNNDYILLEKQEFRLKMVDIILKGFQLIKYNFLDELKDMIFQFIKELLNTKQNSEEYIKNLLFDLDGDYISPGQIFQAFNLTEEGMKHNYYKKWGKHYLLSIMGAHNSEFCNNWKDKGVSNYSTPLFLEKRNIVNEIFNSLPPPKKTKIIYDTNLGISRSITMYNNNVNYSSYNSQNTPCFDGSCRVLLANGIYKRIDEIKKGELLITNKELNKSKVGKVICKTKTVIDDGYTNIVKLNKLKITPTHPIYLEKIWRFPLELGKIEYSECEAIYNLILDNRGCIDVEGYTCATLGHNIKGNKIEHDYYGTDKVIVDLSNLENYEKGEIIIRESMIKRDKLSGWVNKIN